MGTIALSGGGTAGHVMPCVALAEELAKYFDRIIYLGGDGMEKKIVTAAGIPFYETPTVRLDRSHVLNNFRIPFTLSSASKEAKSILQSENVRAVFGKGGYAMLPACFGAKSLGIPLVIHESDYSMGLANKLCAGFASRVLTSFPETPGGIFVGNPVRKEILNGDKRRAVHKYGLNALKPTVLVFGGSSGSLAINEALYPILPSLTQNANVVHITGANDTRTVSARGYVKIEYADDIADLYAVAKVAVIRGGANSLAEVTALGKRAICIPLPKSGSSRGDQAENALSYSKRGLINLLPQSDLTPDELLKRIEFELTCKDREQQPNDANIKIVGHILDVASGLSGQDRLS